jgi:hypothetical protein
VDQKLVGSRPNAVTIGQQLLCGQLAVDGQRGSKAEMAERNSLGGSPNVGMNFRELWIAQYQVAIIGHSDQKRRIQDRSHPLFGLTPYDL